MRIGLSFDVDWAPEEVIEDTLLLLNEYSNVDATFFATHRSKLLMESEHEVGIHPNFNTLLKNESKTDYKSIIDELVELYPNSKGYRGHCLTNSSLIFDYLSSLNFIYESNCLLPYSKSLSIYKYPHNLIRIPFNFEDDVHFGFDKPFDIDTLELDQADLHVFNFHPIHIFINTGVSNHYDKAKKYYQSPKDLIEYRNTKTLGARDLLKALLIHCQEKGIEITSLLNICHSDENIRNNH